MNGMIFTNNIDVLYSFLTDAKKRNLYPKLLCASYPSGLRQMAKMENDIGNRKAYAFFADHSHDGPKYILMTVHKEN